MALTPLSVLIVCTGNSARSILAEAWINHHGAPRLRAYSAGSDPKSQPHPMALTVLKENGYSIDQLRSKRIDEFQRVDSPKVDIVITVCDHAAESCPFFPGATTVIHWGMPDPAAVEEPDAQRAAFEETLGLIGRRFQALLTADPASPDFILALKGAASIT